MSSKAHVSVLIETADGRTIYKDWTGASIRRIHEKAKAQYAKEYPGAEVRFGNGYYVNSYGAH